MHVSSQFVMPNICIGFGPTSLRGGMGHPDVASLCWSGVVVVDLIHRQRDCCVGVELVSRLQRQ